MHQAKQCPQYPLSSDLLALACSNNILVLVVAGLTANASPRIVRIDLAVPDNERTLELYNPNAPNSSASSSSTSRNASSTSSSTAIHKLFLDPSGKHVLVSTPSGDNYYFFSGWENTAKRARLLPKLRNIVINAVGWNSPLSQSASQAAQTSTSTKEILLGDVNGNIYECVLDGGAGSGEDVNNAAAAALRSLARSGNVERHFRQIYSLSSDSRAGSGGRSSSGNNMAITGIRSEVWSAGNAGQSKRYRAAVIVTTHTRLYQFIGSVASAAANVSVAERDEGGMYDDLFKAYRDVLPSKRTVMAAREGDS